MNVRVKLSRAVRYTQEPARRCHAHTDAAACNVKDCRDVEKTFPGFAATSSEQPGSRRRSKRHPTKKGSGNGSFTILNGTPRDSASSRFFRRKTRQKEKTGKPTDRVGPDEDQKQSAARSQKDRTTTEMRGQEKKNRKAKRQNKARPKDGHQKEIDGGEPVQYGGSLESRPESRPHAAPRIFAWEKKNESATKRRRSLFRDTAAGELVFTLLPGSVRRLGNNGTITKAPAKKEGSTTTIGEEI